jgi:hypothetical protein
LNIPYFYLCPKEKLPGSYLEYAGLRPGKLPKIEYIKTQIESESIYQQFLLDHNLPNSTDFKKLLLDD